jgi:hypothetical protein
VRVDDQVDRAVNRAGVARRLHGTSLARRLVLVGVLVLFGLCTGPGAAANAEVVPEAAVVAAVAVIALPSVAGRRSVITPDGATSSRPVGQVSQRVVPHVASGRRTAPRRGPPRPVVRRPLGA